MTKPARVMRVLLLGVVLLVVAIGIRARVEQPLLLLRSPALALRAMVIIYVSRSCDGMAKAIMFASGDPQVRVYPDRPPEAFFNDIEPV